MNYCFEVCGWQKKKKGPSGRRLCPRRGTRRVLGRAAQSQDFWCELRTFSLERNLSPGLLSGCRKSGTVLSVTVSPSPGPCPHLHSPACGTGGRWLLRARRGATSQAFGDALGADPASLGSFPRHRRWAAAEPFAGDRTPPAQPLHAGRERSGRARGLWGHVKTPPQKFRARVTRQINIVSLSDLTGR